ncbi:MAG: phage exclusion protein Lit family protein [Pirellulales bacterium]
MSSPIKHLYKYLIPSMERISPEKAKDLQRLIDEYKVTFVIDGDSPDMVFEANHATKTITLGLRALERLWAQAYAYICLYEFLTRKLLAGSKGGDTDLSTDPVVAPAMMLLSWAVEVEHSLSTGEPYELPWPEELPHPNPTSSKTTLQNAADELFLCAIGSILHHELGHIHRGHDPRKLPQPDESLKPEEDPNAIEHARIRVEWEKEADRWSADWLLDGLDPRDDRFLKRILGISLGFLWGASRNIHTGKFRTCHHPPAWDRVYQNIKQHVPNEPTHPVWLFLCYIIQLHLNSLGQATEVGEFDVPEDWANALLDRLSKIEPE